MQPVVVTPLQQQIFLSITRDSQFLLYVYRMKIQPTDSVSPDTDTDVKGSVLWLQRCKVILAVGVVLLVVCEVLARVGQKSATGMSTITAISLTIIAIGAPGTFLMWKELKSARERRDMEDFGQLLKKNAKLEKRMRELEAEPVDKVDLP